MKEVLAEYTKWLEEHDEELGGWFRSCGGDEEPDLTPSENSVEPRSRAGSSGVIQEGFELQTFASSIRTSKNYQTSYCWSLTGQHMRRPADTMLQTETAAQGYLDIFESLHKPSRHRYGCSHGMFYSIYACISELAKPNLIQVSLATIPAGFDFSISILLSSRCEMRLGYPSRTGLAVGRTERVMLLSVCSSDVVLYILIAK
ncbi:uncharacterized protein EV420DRAFT_1753370, partial [Desarmillaria tabescens]